jgi:uncharacterized membrane protein YvlD (DUF360 family)
MQRERPPRSHLLRQLVTLYAVGVVSLFLVAWVLPGLELGGLGPALLASAFVAAVNTVVWPLVVRYATGLIALVAAVLSIFVNALVLLLAADLVSGLEVSSFGVALVASFGVTVVEAILGNLLSVDDDAVWRRRVIRRMVNRLEPPVPTDVPGVIFMQIDGLSEPVLRRALDDGYLPTLARWLRAGTHRIVRWECDLSSQTGASQAGILHGNNVDMPAFRWYDKEAARVLVSNRPADAALIEAQRSDGKGLLAGGGVSRANVFSGDSDDALFTFSTVHDRARHGRYGFTYVLADPYAITRILVLSGADIVRELAAAWRARRRRIEPRMHRGGVYPLLRAATTVMLRELTVATLMADIYRGVPAAYVDFVGYDEVAHHSGISAHDALEVLYRLDQELARLEWSIAEAPRPYHVVVLSDHGQTQGSTFRQRYGATLGEVVAALVADSDQVVEPELSTEGWGNLNGVLTDAIDEKGPLATLLRTVMKGKTVRGEVSLGPGQATAAARGGVQGDAVVLASGNLGLISFPDIAGRASLERIVERHPRLLPGLAAHPGIGFLLVRSDEHGPLVIGRSGIHHLASGRVEGEDPLAPFGPRAADHLRRTDSFRNAPDVLVNSFYDPGVDEGAAFEELIGFHGGMGGKQTEPFLLLPSAFPVPDGPIVGAATVHQLFKGWMVEAAAGRLEAPWQLPVEAPDRLPLLPGLPEPEQR